MKEFRPISEDINNTAKEIVDAALKVHKALGPGLMESIYEACLKHELSLRGLSVETEVSVPIVYEGLHIPSALRIDMLVEGQVIVELKAVETMNPVFEAQLLSYLKLADKRLGLLINFNVCHLKDGIKRLIL
jgi:GxxExxY protein